MPNVFDRVCVPWMRRYGIPLLRVALGVVFLWFGALKLLGASPIVYIIEESYSFFPMGYFVPALGVLEVVIGVGLIFKIAMRTTLVLLWLQMLGTLSSVLFAPSLFFADGNPLLLTVEGEFLVKNLVLIAASVAVGGYALRNANANAR